MKIRTNFTDDRFEILLQVRFDDGTGFEIIQTSENEHYGIYKETDGSICRIELEDFMEIIRMGMKYRSEFKRYKIYNNKTKKTEIIEAHDAQVACDALGWMSGYCSIEELEKKEIN